MRCPEVIRLGLHLLISIPSRYRPAKLMPNRRLSDIKFFGTKRRFRANNGTRED